MEEVQPLDTTLEHGIWLHFPQASMLLDVNRWFTPKIEVWWSKQKTQQVAKGYAYVYGVAYKWCIFKYIFISKLIKPTKAHFYTNEAYTKLLSNIGYWDLS